MVKPVQRFSYGIDAKRIKTAERKHSLLDHLEHLNPVSVLVMDGVGLASEVQKLLPESKVIHRQYLPKDREKTMYQEGDKAIHGMLDEWQANPETVDLWLHVLNEPDLPANRAPVVDWSCKFAETAYKRGVRCVMGNKGADELEHINAGVWDDYYIAIEKYGHRNGYHEYPPVYPFWIGSAGRVATDVLDPLKCQHNAPNNTLWAPSPYDVQHGSWQGNYFLGRLIWDEKREYHLVNQGRMKAPTRKIVTEWGTDRQRAVENIIIQNNENIYQVLEQRHKHNGLIVPFPHVTLRGFRTWQWIVEDYYNGAPGRNKWTFDEALVEGIKWVHWVYPESVEAFLAFQVCTGAKDWDELMGFNWDDWGAPYMTPFRQNMIAWSRQLESTLPPVEPPPPPPPDPDPEPLPDTPPADNSASLQALATALGAVDVAQATLAGARVVLQEQIDKLKAR